MWTQQNLHPFYVDFATSPFACMHFVPFLIVYPHFTWSPHVTQRTFNINGRQYCREGHSCLRSEVGSWPRTGGPAPWSSSALGSWLGLIRPHLRPLGWPLPHSLVFWLSLLAQLIAARIQSLELGLPDQPRSTLKKMIWKFLCEIWNILILFLK